MKKFCFLALIALIAVTFSSCDMMGGKGSEPSYRLSDLQGLWEENGTEHYIRFTSEQSDEVGYLYGREWDESEWEDEGSFEDFLIEQREAQGYPGNGWFKYKFETKGDLHEIHLMDNGGADIPKEYIVSKLTSDALEYYEKDRKNNKFFFTKVTTAVQD